MMSLRKIKPKELLHNAIFIRLLAVVIIAVLFSVFNGNYIGIKNVRNLMTDMVPYFVMGMGVTFVLLIGSIDLSIGSMASAATCVMAVYLPKIGAWAFVITILMGIAGGFINGYLVAKLKLPSFIATLGMMSVWQSIAYLVSGSQAVQIMKDQWGYIAWAKTYVGIIPVGFIASLVLWAILAKIHTSTAFGKGCVAVGVNERAAQIAGVNATKIKITSFVICECMAALSGIVVAAKLKGGLPTAGDAMTMLAIAAVVLGGTSLNGGKGGLLSTLLGTTMVVMIQNGLNMVGITSFYQDIVFGILIIIAVYFAADRSDRHELVK